MTIKVGDKIPDVKLKKLGSSGMEEIGTADYFKGKKIVLFAVPGAFTPTCAQKHLPGYVRDAEAIKAKGVDEIICLAVNDPFVMKHWGEVAGAEGKVTLLPDGNGVFTKALDMGMDGSGAGLGFRSKRYVMVVDDGVVTDLQIESAPGQLDVSDSQACMVRL